MGGPSAAVAPPSTLTGAPLLLWPLPPPSQGPLCCCGPSHHPPRGPSAAVAPPTLTGAHEQHNAARQLNAHERYQGASLRGPGRALSRQPRLLVLGSTVRKYL
ncbi:unnamed protein product [Gadus morhua 'NCC']